MELVEQFSQARHIRDVPSLLGISSHPQLVDMKSLSTSRLVVLLNYILYRADIDGTFADLSGQQTVSSWCSEAHGCGGTARCAHPAGASV